MLPVNIFIYTLLKTLEKIFKKPVIPDGKRIGTEYFEAAELKFLTAVLNIILYNFKDDIVSGEYLLENIKPDIETEIMVRKVPIPLFSIELEEYMKELKLDDKKIQEYKRILSTNALYFQHLRICKYFIDINLKNNTILRKYEEKFAWLNNFKVMTKNKDIEDMKCNNGVTEEESNELNKNYKSPWKASLKYSKAKTRNNLAPPALVVL